MSNWTFQTNVPIPEFKSGGGRKSKYGFLTHLNQNQSVFVPLLKFKPSLLTQSAHRLGKKLNRKFVTRKLVEKGIPGVRVWRVK